MDISYFFCLTFFCLVAETMIKAGDHKISSMPKVVVVLLSHI
jgi:hypothetical protein